MVVPAVAMDDVYVPLASGVVEVAVATVEANTAFTEVNATLVGAIGAVEMVTEVRAK